ncbi:DUF6978 family protein [uncultured Clostridium sp.]|uniref:Uncharacterized protein n=1 Tax=Ligilactobacillus salivarius TaxID=1624 RepID=A0A6A8LPP3_9LACO|nr:polymorphic toxin type 24 domain-containing protein [uncultured Clostridium sp.]MSE05173.1 hypothetical protein [Ligilactobacillus salivarius]MSE08311.1 hypothetical protein [Ligilactobacillus salivarius]
MNEKRYHELHNLPKVLSNNEIFCALEGQQKGFNGRGIFKENEKFTVIQNRKGHKRKLLSYVLKNNKDGIVIRVDLIGRTHNGIPTPHVHIYDENHNNGVDAIPLSMLETYSPCTESIQSLSEFLKYNKFLVSNLQISEVLV